MLFMVFLLCEREPGTAPWLSLRFGGLLDSHLKRPLPAAHDGFWRAVLLEPVHVHLTRADHKVNVDRAVVAAGCSELIVGHPFPALQAESVRPAQRDMTGRVFVKEHILKEQPGARDGRTARHQRHFSQPTRTFVALDQSAQDGFVPFGHYVGYVPLFAFLSSLMCDAKT